MIALVKRDLAIDIDAIRYAELIHDQKDDSVTGMNLVLDGGALLQINDPKAAQNIWDSYYWKRFDSMYNMIKDTDGYRKLLNP